MKNKTFLRIIFYCFLGINHLVMGMNKDLKIIPGILTQIVNNKNLSCYKAEEIVKLSDKCVSECNLSLNHNYYICKYLKKKNESDQILIKTPKSGNVSSLTHFLINADIDLIERKMKGKPFYIKLLDNFYDQLNETDTIQKLPEVKRKNAVRDFSKLKNAFSIPPVVKIPQYKITEDGMLEPKKEKFMTEISVNDSILLPLNNDYEEPEMPSDQYIDPYVNQTSYQLEPIGKKIETSFQPLNQSFIEEVQGSMQNIDNNDDNEDQTEIEKTNIVTQPEFIGQNIQESTQSDQSNITIQEGVTPNIENNNNENTNETEINTTETIKSENSVNVIVQPELIEENTEKNTQQSNQLGTALQEDIISNVDNNNTDERKIEESKIIEPMNQLNNDTLENTQQNQNVKIEFSKENFSEKDSKTKDDENTENILESVESFNPEEKNNKQIDPAANIPNTNSFEDVDQGNSFKTQLNNSSSGQPIIYKSNFSQNNWIYAGSHKKIDNIPTKENDKVLSQQNLKKKDNKQSVDHNKFQANKTDDNSDETKLRSNQPSFYETYKTYIIGSGLSLVALITVFLLYRYKMISSLAPIAASCKEEATQSFVPLKLFIGNLIKRSSFQSKIF